MRTRLSRWVMGAFLVIVILPSCKRELSCESCNPGDSPTPTSKNRPPIANAGGDQQVPNGTTLLDGKQSYDEDGIINTYSWKQVSGPQQAFIFNPPGVFSIVNNLEEGVYYFELTVTDNDGLSNSDTVQLSVGKETFTCTGSNRPIIQARLIPIGRLSLARYDLYCATVGSKIVFAGGLTSNYQYHPG